LCIEFAPAKKNFWLRHSSLLKRVVVNNVYAPPLLKRVVVNNVYGFLRKNLLESHEALSIPKDQLLRVGITYCTRYDLTILFYPQGCSGLVFLCAT